jgi:tetratricopeptide (TPR) repeat protein
VSDGARERLCAEPLLQSLPLGSTAALPVDTVPAPSAAPTPSVSRSSAPSLDELVTEAERLSDIRHPHARQAWERIAASGHELPPVIAARIDRSRARTLLERDPAAARGALASVAERLAELGEDTEARETRANAAFAAFLAGDRETAEAEAVVVGAEAEAAYAAGDLTARQYLSARSLPVFIAFNAFARLADPTVDADEHQYAAAEPQLAAELISSELEIAEKLGDPGRVAVYQRMLAQLAFRRNDRTEAGARLEASRDAALQAGQPWDAVEPADLLAQLALQQGDVTSAERHARDALAHGGDLLDRTARARLYSLLTEVLWQQPERRLDVVDAALRAGDLWDGTSEPDSLHNRFIAARAYAGLKRHGEAAALFDELMPRVNVPYDSAGVAMTREQYADCLTQLGEHRRAAEQYLAAATLVQDDPRNRLPHARLAWSAAQALQSAGLTAEALPAYRRAADLWGEIGNLAARARCLRSAAWLIGWSKDDGEDATDDAPARWTQALAAMRAVLAELTALPPEDRPEPIAEEIGHTNDQLRQMLGCLREAEQQAGGGGAGE